MVIGKFINGNKFSFFTGFNDLFFFREAYWFSLVWGRIFLLFFAIAVERVVFRKYLGVYII